MAQITDHLPKAQIILSDADFDDIERAGGIKLNEDLRRRLQNAIRSYEFRKSLPALRIGTTSDRRRLATSRKSLSQLIKSFSSDDPVHAWVAWDAGSARPDPLAMFTSLRDEIDRRRAPRKADPGRYRYLPQFMYALEEIFLAAGGVTTRISRESEDKGRTRVSPFLNFAHAVALPLSASVRIPFGQTLASAWEDIRRIPRTRLMRFDAHYRVMARRERKPVNP